MRPAPKPIEVMHAVRRGTSLIEMVVAIGVATIVLTTGLTVTHMLLNTERAVTKSVLSSSNVTRLSRALRTDAHAAERVEITPPDAEHGQRVTLLTADKPFAIYQIDGHSVSRSSNGDGTQNKDQFKFPEESELRFEQSGTSQQLNLVLKLAPVSHPMPAARNSSAGATPRRTIRIEATLARDGRFARRN